MWVLYVVEGRRGTYYTGISKDPERRLRQHNGEIAGGAKFTRSRRPWRLVAQWPMPSFYVAVRAERWFKKLKKSRKKLLVKNPGDLEACHFE